MAQQKAAVDRRIVDAVSDAAAALVGVAARSMSEVEGRVSLPQWRLLVVLHARGPLPSGEAARELATGPSSLSRLADRLVTAGLITRQPSPESRRVVCLDLSAEGRRLVRSVLRRRRRELSKVLSAMSEDHQQGLVEALVAFNEAAVHHFNGEVPLGPL